jgi:DNA ligase-3
MAENTYSVGYATNARAKCKYSGCAESIGKDSLRIIKSCSSGFSEKPKAEYYHAECMFLSFVRARKTTKKIESMKDIEGVDSIKPEDKENIKKYIKQFKDGELKDKIPKITRKRKADTDKADTKNTKRVKKAKDSSSESEEEKEEKVKPKTKVSPVKRKPTKKTARQ